MEGYTYLLSLCVILMSTKIFSILSRRAQLPQVVGALMAGLFFGPAVLGAITNNFFGVEFCLQPTQLLARLAELGVIVIMFTAGMETNLDELKASGAPGFVVALSGVILPLGMGAGLMYLFDDRTSFESAIFIGAVLTATSVSITVETLKELGKMSTKVGNTILAAALIDDILGLICLTIITGMGGEEETDLIMLSIKIVGFFVFVGIAGLLYNIYMKWSDRVQAERNLRRYPVLGFAFCLFMAWAAETIFGVADIIGAFAAGMIIALSPKGQYVASKFDTVSYLLLTPIFFANIGLEVVLPSMSFELVAFTAALIAVAIISKLGGCGLGAMMCKFDKRQSYQIGLGMVCRGEVSLIVMKKGMSMHFIAEEYLGPIIIMIIVCTILTPILLKWAFAGQRDAVGDTVFEDAFMTMDQADEITDDLFERRLRLSSRTHE
ncbi:MAG: cation:proton antiporter [Synergistaceae bacterium]|nr:cation:proton antiporter [Synergistaceae bacterium]